MPRHVGLLSSDEERNFPHFNKNTYANSQQLSGPLFNCRVQTVENLRKGLVNDGFAPTLDGKQRRDPPTPPKLDGQAEAKLIAMRLGTPPKGFGKWILQLLAEQLVTLEVVDSICPETVRKTLKKTA